MVTGLGGGGAAATPETVAHEPDDSVWWTRAAWNACVLAVLAFRLGWAGPGSDMVRRTAVVVLLVVGMALAIRSGLIRAAGLLLCLGLAWWAPEGASLLAAAAGSSLLMLGADRLAKAILAASLTACLASVFPWIEEPLRWVARRLAASSGEQGVGPTLLGLPALLMVLFGCLPTRRPASLVAILGVLVCWWIHVQSTFAACASDGGLAPAASSLAWSVPAMAFLGALGTTRAGPAAGVAAEPGDVGRISLGAAVVLMAAGVTLAWRPPAAEAPEHVRFLNEGGIDWHRPRFGEYGAFSGGMFGLLPEYLSAAGVRCSATDPDPQLLTLEDLGDADIFVVINSPRIWTAEERRVLHSYLESGGSVLVLGDHTNVFGLQQGLNSLLDEYDIQFEFDSAYPLRWPWESCAGVSPWPGVPDLRHSGQLHLSVGASLSCGPGVHRLVTGRYAFSDIGVPTNMMGSFLGNYAHDPGELVGDLALVAWRRVGEGKLLVYGDTSPFQNSALPVTFGGHVAPLMAWLAGGDAPTWGLLWPWGLMVAFGLVFGSGVARAATATSALAILVAATSPGWRGGLSDARRWVVETSCQPWIGHFEAGMNSIGPQLSYAMRGGFLVEQGPAATDELGAGDVISLVAPSRELNAAEVERYLAYLERGGQLVVAAGHERGRGARPLLQALGLEIVPTPLGTVPDVVGTPAQVVTAEAPPRFLDSWPIRRAVELAGDTVLYQQGEFVIALHRTVGRGGLLLIGDPLFFSQRNLEGTWGHHVGNARFLFAIFEQLLGCPTELSADRFPSPVKPR